MTDVTIHHNPRCGTSRNVLALIREAGIEPAIVEYLKQPPSREQLAALAAQAGIPVRGLLRSKESLYAELGLDDASLDDDALLDALAAHPILFNRPFVATPRGAAVCRPAETVLALLPVGA